METKFGSRAEMGAVAVEIAGPPTGEGGGEITRASGPPTKRNDRMVCGTPSSVTVKSDALSLVASDRFLRRATTSRTTSRTLLRITAPALSGDCGSWAGSIGASDANPSATGH